MARVGDKLGRYELLEQLGKGAAGTVYRARDTLLGIDVCVKVLHTGLGTQPGIVERFKRELLLARRVAHPGICKIFDIQEADGTHFLTMEYVKGETLSTRLNRDGQMRAKDAVRIMRKVAEALGAAHKAGVVHRDVKPGNIIIGENERVTIVDFGVATAEDLERLTRAGVVLGSRSYMAPESWQGKPATAAGDVWALGVILYGCVTGRLPYKGEGVIGVFEAIKTTKPIPPSALNSDVTPELEELIFKAMCVDVDKRFPDATAVEAALATLELTLGDDDASLTLVRPTVPAPVARAPSSLPAPSASPSPAPSSARSAERLHRPSAQPLPRPTAPAELHKTVELTRTPEGVVEPSAPSVPSEELSLYAPGDPAGTSALSGEQGDPTQVVKPLPDVGAAPDPLSPENVAEAFDAAFDLGALSSGPLSPLSPHDTLPPASVTPARDSTTVIVPAPPELSSPGAVPEGGGLVEEELKTTPLDIQALPLSPEPRSEATAAVSLAELAGGGIPDDRTAPTATLSADSLSLYPAASGEIALSPLDTQRVEPLADPEGEAQEVAPHPLLGTQGPARNKRVLVAAAAGFVGVGLLVLVASVFFGSDDEAVTVAAAVGTQAPLDEAGKLALPEQALEEPPTEPAGEQAAEASEPAALATDTDAPLENAAEAEGAADAEREGANAAEGVDVDDGAAGREAVAAVDEDADAEGAEAAGFAAGDDGTDVEEPREDLAAAAAAPAEEGIRAAKQRANPEAAARSRFNRKRSALNAAFAKKGLRPGDAPAIDEKRQQMNQAAKRRDYARAADAADEAMREIAKVKIDAAFIGRKLARLNQSYDRTTDEGLRVKLKGVLKDVGGDYSAGRFEEANKKLNRAFSLMNQ